jgi:FkbM family methyltransferase
MMAHTIYNDKWNADNGNETRILNYPLDENSLILELGAFQGWFTQKAINKFNCNIIAVEPVFCSDLQEKFKNNNKVIIECCGISNIKKSVKLYIDGDATSQYSAVSNKTLEISCFPMEYFIEKHKIDIIDLVQVNIEGEEYSLLEKWITSDFLNKVKIIQVQYHDFVDNYRDRKQKIEQGLINRGFVNQWDYDIVFSSWKNTNFE